MGYLICATISYIIFGTWFSCRRAWKIGVHRSEAHQGQYDPCCWHWGCDAMVKEITILMLLLWPVIVPISAVCRIFDSLMNAPYQKSLPPKNEAPGRVISGLSNISAAAQLKDMNDASRRSVQ